MARKTTTLLPLSGANALDVTGDAVPGDSYYAIYRWYSYSSNIWHRFVG